MLMTASAPRELAWRRGVVWCGASSLLCALALWGVTQRQTRLSLCVPALPLVLMVGAAVKKSSLQWGLLAILLLVPDAISHATFGLNLRWSPGLTLSNYVLPVLALPLWVGALLGGQGLWPSAFPKLARGYLWLLAWCGISLTWALSSLTPGTGATELFGHWIKLIFFVLLGLYLAPETERARRKLETLFFAGMAINGAVGIGQLLGWLPVFSPLAGGQDGATARVCGLFYDANMYSVLVAWAFLWVACVIGSRHGWARLGLFCLAALLAINLVASGSRAGMLAIITGLSVLLIFGRWRVLLAVAALLAIVLPFAPRTRARMTAAVDVTSQESSAGPALVHDEGTEKRLQSMREGVRQMVLHPWLGIGFGRALYLGIPVAGVAAGEKPGAQFNGAQNMFITVWAETGIPGILLFIGALLASVRALIKQARTESKARIPSMAAPAVPALAGFIGLIAASTTIELLWNARLLALVIALTAGASGMVRDPTSAQSKT